MPDRDADQSFDAKMRAVPVPDRLVARLRGIAALSDDELDYRLRAVSIPFGLLDRVRRDAADALLDQRVRDVPVSPNVVPRARAIPMIRRRSRIARLALAASLLILVGAGYAAAMVAMLAWLRPASPMPAALVIVDRGPLRIVSPAEPSVQIVPGPARTATPPAMPAASRQGPFELLQLAETPTPGPAGELFAEINHQWNPWDNWLLKRWGVLGYSHDRDVQLPDLRSVRAPTAHGIPVPLWRTLDREFLFGRGVHPPAFVSAERAAGTMAVPLWAETASVDATARRIAEGRLPKGDQVRVEDFLAAMDYAYAPARPRTLAVRTAAGPSVYNPAAAGLLQVGVKAGRPQRRTLAATHLVVALDISASMDWDGKLDVARRALCQMLRYLGPKDRFSLIVFNDDAYLVVDEAGREDREALFDVLQRLRAEGDADLAGALQMAVATALASRSDAIVARRLVLIAGRASTLVADQARKIEGMLDEATAPDLRFDVFDLSGRDEPDPVLEELTSRTGGAARPARDAEQIRWSLVQALSGDPTLVAEGAVLEVRFNPKAVVAYRLIGHEATAFGGMLPGAIGSDLHVDQEATALFEVWLYPNDQDDIATVKLRWTEPESGTVRRAPDKRVRRSEFASSFERMPPSLQAAAIAAETGEILRRSFDFAIPVPGVYQYRPKPRNLQRVLEASEHVDPRLRMRAEFRHLISLVQQASRMTIQRRTSQVKTGTRALIAGRWRES